MSLPSFRHGLTLALVAALAGCGAAAPPGAAETAAAEQGDAVAVFTWNDALDVFPATLGYTPGHDYDADYCELFVNGFGAGNFANGGATVDWLEAYLSVPAQQGKLLNVAMYTRAAHGETITLAVPIAPNYWRTGFTTHRNAPGGGTSDDPVVDFAFFVDVERPSGEVVRLWQSDHGANYTPAQVFALPPSGVVDLGGGSVTYASNQASLFDQKRACQ